MTRKVFASPSYRGQTPPSRETLEIAERLETRARLLAQDTERRIASISDEKMRAAVRRWLTEGV